MRATHPFNSMAKADMRITLNIPVVGLSLAATGCSRFDASDRLPSELANPSTAEDYLRVASHFPDQATRIGRNAYDHGRVPYLYGTIER